MTRGHFHFRRNRGEYYLTLAGMGALILMDEARRTWCEFMKPGSLHYIPAQTAHRVANTGTSVLSFLACWPSDAGHDYESVAKSGAPIIASLQSYVREHAWTPWGEVQIRLAQLGDQAALLGAIPLLSEGAL